VLQDELDTLGLPVPVKIFGINEVGHESGNETMCEGRDLPWLQPTTEEPVWATWGIEYRDVVLLDGENRAVAVYNLTTNDLSEPLLYEELRTLFIDASNARATPDP
jgi:hypothetical protein